MSSVAARLGRVLREAALTLAALGGVVCIVLAVLAFSGGYTLIMFKTGSMSPTIPAGSVALVQRVPASDLVVGDVVTVDRPNALPVTHRVTAVLENGSRDDRVITLKGDANESEDPAPYTVSEVRIVRASLPHLANVIVWFGNPIVLGGLTVGTAALVTWAFWPRDRRQQDVVAIAEDTAADTKADGAPSTRRERRAAGILGVIALFAATAAPLVAPGPAHAAGSLRLSSDLAGTQTLDAVDPLNWHLDVDGSSLPGDGVLTIALSGAEAPDGLQIVAEVRSCASAWTTNGCASGEKLLRPASRVKLDGTWEQVHHGPTPIDVHLRIVLTAPEAHSDSASASLTIRANAAGQTAEETVNGEDALAATGGTSWAVYAAPGAVLIGLGVATIARAHRRRAS
ncbi:signal peptidase I [Microbacterium sp. ZKA21]|uniref:signal peptidase I n=1 Tax=Microbacterium sp. ZKA21 TaxID=3381694 RepID=UPI003D1B9BE9